MAKATLAFCDITEKERAAETALIKFQDFAQNFMETSKKSVIAGQAVLNEYLDIKFGSRVNDARMTALVILYGQLSMTAGIDFKSGNVAEKLNLTDDKSKMEPWQEAINWTMIEIARAIPPVGVEPYVERRLQPSHA